MAIPTRKLTIRSFEAVKDMAACLEFSEGYTHVLTDQGFSHGYINKHNWISTAGIYGILAEYEGKIVGGVMLWIPVQEKRFPFEEVIQISGKKSKAKVGIEVENNGELFALWHANAVAGWGLSYILLKAGLALAEKLQVQKTYYLVVDYNIRLSEKLGFQQETKNGVPIYYTIQVTSITQKVYLCYFSLNDIHSATQEKHEIKEIAEKEHLTRIESVLSGKLEIEYKLSLN